MFKRYFLGYFATTHEMLCRKFKQISAKYSNSHVAHSLISSRFFSKRCIDLLYSVRTEGANMSSSLRLRNILKDLVITRFFSGWTRSYLVSSVVKRCRRDRGVREVIQCFRQAFRPRRTLLLSVAAAYKSQGEGPPTGCNKNISDEELQALVTELEGVEELTRATLYCGSCAKRVILDKRQPGVRYCVCKDAEPPQQSFEGWVPYMEAEDVIIWRKEYKPGKGLYAYKVYGRYKDIKAQDFAAIQVDGAYRRAWDTAVAALSIVERQANGVLDQAVLHWEVLWPRLFANRDYVYIRRHKEFDVKTRCQVHTEGVFNPSHTCKETPAGTPTVQLKVPEPVETETQDTAPDVQEPIQLEERPNVHSNAKRKVLESERLERAKLLELAKQKLNKEKVAKEFDNTETVSDKIENCSNIQGGKEVDKKQNGTQNSQETKEMEDNKVYVIVSRSCIHPHVPVTRNAIRVTEYWSHMVVKTLNGPDKPGAEFVLTYYDEPAVGGLPTAVASFATGRAAPAFLARMRQAAVDYKKWRARNHQEAPDFTPFGPEKVSFDTTRTKADISEEEMESSKQGPELDKGYKVDSMRDQETQTEDQLASPKPKEEPDDEDDGFDDDEDTQRGKEDDFKLEKVSNTQREEKSAPEKISKSDTAAEKNGDKSEGEDKSQDERGWWRYLYPFYYFV